MCDSILWGYALPTRNCCTMPSLQGGCHDAPGPLAITNVSYAIFCTACYELAGRAKQAAG